MLHYSGMVIGGSSPHFTSSHLNTLWQLLPWLDIGIFISMQHFTKAIWVVFSKPVIDWKHSACLWLCPCSVAPCMQSGWGIKGGTKALFVPLSCIFACGACCGGRPVAADEPSEGGEKGGCGGKGGTACLTVACGGWRGGGTVAMVTWLRKVWGLDAVWLLLPLLLRSSVFDESPPLFNTWTLKRLMWEEGEDMAGIKIWEDKMGKDFVGCWKPR